MSQLTDKAKQIAEASQELVNMNERMDDLHEQFNKAIQEYKDILTVQAGPEKAEQVAPISLPTMKGDTPV